MIYKKLRGINANKEKDRVSNDMLCGSRKSWQRHFQQAPKNIMAAAGIK